MGGKHFANLRVPSLGSTLSKLQNCSPSALGVCFPLENVWIPFLCKKGKERLRVQMPGLVGHEITVGQLIFPELSVKKSTMNRTSFPAITQGCTAESKLPERLGRGSTALSGNRGPSQHRGRGASGPFPAPGSDPRLCKSPALGFAQMPLFLRSYEASFWFAWKVCKFHLGSDT